MKNNKIIVILGPTAAGKSGVAIKLAKKFNGEIISADSRQIYKGMEINSGAVPVDEQIVPHYFVNIADPTEEYNVAKFKKQAEKIIEDILVRKKLPIICGGTGFWIKAIVDSTVFPEVKPDWQLREKLNKESAEKLFNRLKGLDSRRAKNIDSKNKVRLIRAIEICKKLGKVPSLRSRTAASINYKFLQIGIKREKEKLHKRIQLNVTNRIKQGMLAEIEKLHNNLSWEKIENFGLSFKLIPQYLRKEITSKEELEEKIYLAEKNYAKRQMTWFKKDSRIKWMLDYSKIENTVKNFLKK